MGAVRPGVELKVDMYHEPRNAEQQERAEILIEEEHTLISDVRFSGGHRASACFVKFDDGLLEQSTYQSIARRVASWADHTNYAPDCELEKWLIRSRKCE